MLQSGHLLLLPLFFIALFAMQADVQIWQESTQEHRQAALDLLRDEPNGLLPYLQSLSDSSVDPSSLLLEFDPIMEPSRPIMTLLQSPELVQGCLELIESLPVPVNPIAKLCLVSHRDLKRILDFGARPYVSLSAGIPWKVHDLLEPYQMRYYRANLELMTIRQVLRGLRRGQAADPAKLFCPALFDPLMGYFGLDKEAIEEHLTEAPHVDRLVLNYYRKTL